jgi:DNA polymerase V
MTLSLSRPTNDTRELVEAVLAGLRRIYRGGFRYIKAGVMLSDIAPAGIGQGDLFTDHPTAPSNSDLMKTMDQINIKMGKGVLKLASDGVMQSWQMKTGNRSPAYTTRWSELAVAI